MCLRIYQRSPVALQLLRWPYGASISRVRIDRMSLGTAVSVVMVVLVDPKLDVVGACCLLPRSVLLVTLDGCCHQEAWTYEEGNTDVFIAALFVG